VHPAPTTQSLLKLADLAPYRACVFFVDKIRDNNVGFMQEGHASARSFVYFFLLIFGIIYFMQEDYTSVCAVCPQHTRYTHAYATTYSCDSQSHGFLGCMRSTHPCDWISHESVAALAGVHPVLWANNTGPNDRTTLMMAAKWNNVEMVKTVVHRMHVELRNPHLAINSRDSDNRNAVAYAASHNSSVEVF
jgi:hypothetical protein